MVRKHLRWYQVELCQAECGDQVLLNPVWRGCQVGDGWWRVSWWAQQLETADRSPEAERQAVVWIVAPRPGLAAISTVSSAPASRGAPEVAQTNPEGCDWLRAVHAVYSVHVWAQLPGGVRAKRSPFHVSSVLGPWPQLT